LGVNSSAGRKDTRKKTAAVIQSGITAAVELHPSGVEPETFGSEVR